MRRERENGRVFQASVGLVAALALSAFGAGGARAENPAAQPYGEWQLMKRDVNGMTFESTMTVTPDKVGVFSRCSFGDKQVEVETSSPATVTADRITVLETKNVQREHSPGFLNCRAAIKADSLSYRMEGGKLVLIAASGREMALSRVAR